VDRFTRHVILIAELCNTSEDPHVPQNCVGSSYAWISRTSGVAHFRLTLIDHQSLCTNCGATGDRSQISLVGNTRLPSAVGHSAIRHGPTQNTRVSRDAGFSYAL
jgi:hypothetical protein